MGQEAPHKVGVGPCIHQGINLFLVKVLNRQRAIWAMSLQVMNVPNHYVMSNHEYKHLTLSLGIVIRKANYRSI